MILKNVKTNKKYETCKFNEICIHRRMKYCYYKYLSYSSENLSNWISSLILLTFIQSIIPLFVIQCYNRTSTTNLSSFSVQTPMKTRRYWLNLVYVRLVVQSRFCFATPCKIHIQFHRWPTIIEWISNYSQRNLSNRATAYAITTRHRSVYYELKFYQ